MDAAARARLEARVEEEVTVAVHDVERRAGARQIAQRVEHRRR
jgi:hypothetical protein